MKLGGYPPCLNSVSSLGIKMSYDLQELDEGYRERAHKLGNALVVITILMLLATIVAVVYTIHKSQKQKECRLQYYNVTDALSQMSIQLEALQNDR